MLLDLALELGKNITAFVLCKTSKHCYLHSDRIFRLLVGPWPVVLLVGPLFEPFSILAPRNPRLKLPVFYSAFDLHAPESGGGGGGGSSLVNNPQKQRNTPVQCTLQ